MTLACLVLVSALVGRPAVTVQAQQYMDMWRSQETSTPLASFTYEPSEPVVSEPVTFNASASYDPNGTIASYTWYFGDGTSDTGVVVTHAYSADRTYTVILKVTDDEGLTDITTAHITVSPAVHDIAVTSIKASSLKVNVTDPSQVFVTISVDVANEGNLPETFEVTIKYDQTVIDTKTVTNLPAGGSTTVDFEWDVRGLALRTYEIEAEAILAGDTDPTNNKRASDWSIEIVPEFPTGIPMLLALAVLVVFTVILKRRTQKHSFDTQT